MANDVAELRLKPSSGGVFFIRVNSETVFNNKELKRFPNEGEALAVVEAAVQSAGRA